MAGLSSVWYGAGAESAQDYGWLAGHWLSGLTPPPAGAMLYQDWFGVRVGGEFETAGVPKRVPEYLSSDDLDDLLKKLGDLIPRDYQDCVRKCKRWLPPFLRPRGFCEWLCARFFDPTPPQKPKPEPAPSPQPTPSPNPSPEPFKCPEGLCMFVCPGQPPACAPPGATVECPGGVKITLPPDCAKGTETPKISGGQ